jgi:uncharacterized protein (DUF486 family)
MSSPYWGKHAGKSGKLHLPGIVFVVLFVVEVFLSHSWTSTLGPFKKKKKPLFQIQLISWIIEIFFWLKTCASFVPHREFKLGERRSPEACLLEMW